MLCTDVNGLYTGNPANPESEMIPTYCPEVQPPANADARCGLDIKLQTLESIGYLEETYFDDKLI